MKEYLDPTQQRVAEALDIDETKMVNDTYASKEALEGIDRSIATIDHVLSGKLK